VRVTSGRLWSSLLLFGLLLIATSVAGPGAHGAVFVGALLELLLFFALLWLPGWVLLRRLRPNGLDESDAFLLALPTSLLGYAAIGVPLLWISAPALIFKLVFLPLVGAAAYLFLRDLSRGGDWRVPPSLPLTWLIAACAVCFVCVGQTQPWQEMSWAVPAVRGLHRMPIDNNLPFMTARVFIDGTPPWIMGASTMGDRPPLMGVITAVFAKAFLFRRFTFFDFSLLAILLNSLYTIPLVRYAEKILPSRRTALFVAVSLVLTPPLFLNVYFTWPKTFAMFFTLTGLALFTRRSPDSPWCFPALRSVLLLGVLLGLGVLSHANSALSIPLIFVLLACFGRTGATFAAAPKRGLLRLAAGAGVVAAAVLLLQAPWKVYKLQHPEVDTNLLLYHYIPHDPPEKPPPLFDWLASTGLEVQLAQRVQQVRETLLGGDFRAVLRTLATGDVVAFNRERWNAEFLRPAVQVGELRILLGSLAMAALATSGWWRMPGLRLPALATPDLRMSMLTIAFALANYLVHVFLKWKTIAPHELPLLEVQLVAVPLTVACFAFSRAFGFLLMLAITLRFFAWAVACTFARQLPADLFAFGMFAAVFGLLWLCLGEPETAARTPPS
jgi:4-amino-4-deoxy-L-arabinose transferase-like glycosyltransferase